MRFITFPQKYFRLLKILQKLPKLRKTITVNFDFLEMRHKVTYVAKLLNYRNWPIFDALGVCSKTPYGAYLVVQVHIYYVD